MATLVNTAPLQRVGMSRGTGKDDSLERSQSALLPRRPAFPTPSPSVRVSNSVLPTSKSNAFTSPLAQLSSTQILDSPLPFVPLTAPQPGSLRASLKRRRSSFPPASIPGSSITHDFPWVVGGTSIGKTLSSTTKPDWNIPLPVPHLGPETISSTPNSSSLLHFDPTPLHTPTNLLSSLSLPSSDSQMFSFDSDGAGPSTPRNPRSPGSVARSGSDLAWKTILESVVDVEGVGEVDVIKIMIEVWRRGGGDFVTAQNLWLNIVIALQLPSQSVGARIPTPSAESASGLQKVYNLTLRPWEASIFCGLLSTYSSSVTRPASTPYYGPATPTKELDMSQWTNFSPGTGDLASMLTASMTPKHALNVPSSLGQFEFHMDERRRSSTAESISGLEALLAEMEEGHAANERAAIPDALRSYQEEVPFDTRAAPQRRDFIRQLPTPGTDSTSPNAERRQSSSAPASCALSPDNAASPFVTASTSISAISQAMSSSSHGDVPTNARVAPPNSCSIPPSTFVPPPPMCMFFSPQFRDLEKGKVGVWKGDLEITGRGGGRFSILIVGEENTGHLWQSHLWPSTISYPVESSAPSQADASSCTSTMIPVAHLAREGFTPTAMGMVLCNDANIEAYVSMVQGFHAEGVAFHLPNPTKLPIVFLPAKFDSSDQIQRLGIAFMSKPGMPLPKPVSLAVKEQAKAAADEKKRKKQRRQSAPAKAQIGHRRRRSSASSTTKPLAASGTLREDAISEE